MVHELVSFDIQVHQRCLFYIEPFSLAKHSCQGHLWWLGSAGLPNGECIPWGNCALSSGGCHFWHDGYNECLLISCVLMLDVFFLKTFPSFLAKFAKDLFAGEVSSSMENKGDFIELLFSILDPLSILICFVPFGWLRATWATSAEAFRSSSSFGPSSWLPPFVLVGMIQ